MKILFILILCLIEGGVVAFNLKGYAGGSILINCNSTFDKSTKSFCKDAKNLGCVDFFMSNVSEHWQGKGRISLYDNNSKGFFKVAMRNLTVSDTGKYWCKVNRRRIEGTAVHLNVIEDKRESRIELGYVGQDISIKCPYDIKYTNELKYLCKNEGVACKDRMIIWIKDKWVNSPYKDKKRFSLYDNTTGGVFIVSITNLTKEDAGIYWCGVHVSFQKNSPLSVDNITEVILNVKNADNSGNPPPGPLPLIPLALVLSLAVGVLVLGMALFFCRRCGKKITKAPTSPDIPIYTNTAENTQGTGDYVNAGVQEPQANTPTGPMRSNRPYSDPDYQNSNMSDTTTYQTLIASTRQNDSIYHTLHPRTNQQ